MQNARERFLAHNMGMGQFASETMKKPDTVSDWRKRGMLEGYGQPHPNGNGRWIYSKEDATAVYVAEQLKESGGYTWATALQAGLQLTAYLVGREMYAGTESGAYYDHPHAILIDTPEGVFCHLGLTLDQAFDATPGSDRANHVARIVSLDAVFSRLPGDIQYFLKALRHEGSD